MIFTTNEAMPTWLKRISAIAGLVLALAGLPVIFGFFCITLLMTMSDDREAIEAGLISFTLMAVTVGGGGVVFWHSLRSLQGRVSRPMLLPPIWLLAGIFGLWVALGLFIVENKIATGLFFLPILLVTAILSPVWAISWFINRRAEELTWRRGLIAFAGGATVSAVIAIILEILFPTIILALVFNLADPAIDSIEKLFKALIGKDIASAITSRGFIYVFVQMAIIAPLAEELAKPLVTLPLLGRLSRRGAFLVGAMAGAGFAALENIIYAGFGFFFWAGILAIRALGSAIHPLGTGLVALGWRDVLRGEPHGWLKWFGRFSLAVGLHAFWNGGSLLVVTLAGARFFGELPPEIDILGLSAAGTTLALLFALGLVALWLGRSLTAGLVSPDLDKGEVEAEFTLSDKTIALWALACLVAIVPAGIAGLQILVR